MAVTAFAQLRLARLLQTPLMVRRSELKCRCRQVKGKLLLVLIVTVFGILLNTGAVGGGRLMGVSLLSARPANEGVDVDVFQLGEDVRAVLAHQDLRHLGHQIPPELFQLRIAIGLLCLTGLSVF